MSDSLQPHGLCSPWNSPGQNTGVGSFSLLQGIFPTQGLNPGLSHCRQILYQLSHKGSPWGRDFCPNSKHLLQAAQKSLLNFWMRVCLKPHPSFLSVFCSSYMKFFFILFFVGFFCLLTSWLLTALWFPLSYVLLLSLSFYFSYVLLTLNGSSLRARNYDVSLNPSQFLVVCFSRICHIIYVGEIGLDWALIQWSSPALIKVWMFSAPKPSCSVS